MQMPSHFYGMIDPAGGHEPVALARLLLAAGARIMQLRLKNIGSREFLAIAREIAKLCQAVGAIFVVNDRVDIAWLSEAHGVHLGQEDLPLQEARRMLGQSRIIGISTHSIEQARAAESGGADYIGFGAIYSGGLKRVKNPQGLERLRRVRKVVNLPIVAIGGITEASLPEVLQAGADAAAIITDVVTSSNIHSKVQRLVAIG